MVAKIKDTLPGEALIMSTGVIGRQIDLEKITKGISILAGSLKADSSGWKDASRAIMTTDTVPKLAHLSAEVGSKVF